MPRQATVAFTFKHASSCQCADIARLQQHGGRGGDQAQARFRSQARKKLTEQRQRDADILAYEKATREREFRMRQREEQKAMLLELPAGEVEDWQRQQEHTAATTVQSSFRRLKAKKEVAKLKGRGRDQTEGASEGRGDRAQGDRGREVPRPNDALDREYPDPDAADVLTASLEASRVSDLTRPRAKRPSPAGYPRSC